MPDANTEENTVSLCSVTFTNPLGTYTEKHEGSKHLVCNVTLPSPPLRPPCPGPFISLSPHSFPQPRIGSREQRLMFSVRFSAGRRACWSWPEFLPSPVGRMLGEWGGLVLLPGDMKASTSEAASSSLGQRFFRNDRNPGQRPLSTSCSLKEAAIFSKSEREL